MPFDFSRKEGFPTQYPPNETAVTFDVLEAGLVTAFLILIIAFYVSIPTTRTITNVSQFLRTTIILLIGLFVLLSNFGQEWEVGHILSKTPYKAGSSAEINASIGIKIGLRSVNVTLKSIEQPKSLRKEIINYNERFSWEWDQGRFGFGPYAGHLQQEFRAAQYRGLPLPILWVMDYFVIDGEGFRFGRFYRTAGWYCHVVLWCAFTCWVLSAILFRSVIRYGAYLLGTGGFLQILANFLWFVIRNPLPLKIPFEDATIVTKFGASYWLNFASGCISVSLAVIIVVADFHWDAQLYTFFGVDPLNIYDVAYLSKEEQDLRRHKPRPSFRSNDIPLIETPQTSEMPDEVEYMPVYIRRNSRIPPPVIRSNKPKNLML